MTFDQADDYVANQDRSYCLVPDCDEQPYPGETLCLTHQQEEIARERAEAVTAGRPGANK